MGAEPASENANKESEKSVGEDKDSESETANKESVDAEKRDEGSVQPQTTNSGGGGAPTPSDRHLTADSAGKKAATAKAHFAGENTNPNTNPAAVVAMDDLDS